MLKIRYKKGIIHILHFLNYNKIENEDGTNHLIINFIDLFLAVVYAVFSCWKLHTVTPVVVAMNFLTLARLLLSNIREAMEFRDRYESMYLARPGSGFRTVHEYKIIIEICVIAFSLVPFWIQGVLFEAHVIKSFAGIIIILGLIENFINIHVKLFKASIDIGGNTIWTFL